MVLQNPRGEGEENRGRNSAPDLDAEAQAYDRGFNNGETYAETHDTRRRYAPGPGYSKENILPGLINRSREVNITKPIAEFLDALRDSNNSNTLKNLTDLRVYPCDDPKSVYVLRAKTVAGDTIAALMGFVELIGNDIPRSFERSRVLVEAAENLSRTEPGTIIVMSRLYTKSDVENRSAIMLREITYNLNALADSGLQTLTVPDLTCGDVNFVVQTRNRKAGEDFFLENSPNGIIPAMNACVTIEFRQNTNSYGIRDQKADPIVATALMIDFIEVDRNARWGNTPQFMPRIRITGIEAVAPAACFVFWGLVFPVEKYGTNYGWMEIFNQADALTGDPANLFADPTDPSGQTLMSVEPKDLNAFWNQYGQYFGDPIILLDLEFGRKTIPFQFDFYAASIGDEDAEDKIIRSAIQFFGEKSPFWHELKRNGGPICSPFAHSHTSVITLKDYHFDSRAITYLSALNGAAGIGPSQEVGMALLQPNRIDAPDMDNILTDWLGVDVVNPMFDCYSVVLNEGFLQALGVAIRESGMLVDDNDTNSRRAMFSGRNSIEGYGFSGRSMGVFNSGRRGFNTGRGSNWAAYAGDYRR